MLANERRIQTWAQSKTNRVPLTFIKRVAGDVGYGVTRTTGQLTRMNKVIVVLKYQTYNNMPYYILTAHIG
ncbi:hypothetical protein HDG35_000372 [Paraburkholderia sp. JPY681]|nr:hypothetical protein [Paraburkholderia atlantica]